MASQTASPLRAGQVLKITFPTFKPRITVGSDHELTVEVVAGENVGFSDTVEYEVVTIRDGLVMLSWQEHIGSTIVHVLDLVERYQIFGCIHRAIRWSKERELIFRSIDYSVEVIR
jgi:hypothetical protein